MKKICILINTILISLLIIGCDKEFDNENNRILGGDNSVSGRVDFINKETGDIRSVVRAIVFLGESEEFPIIEIDTNVLSQYEDTLVDDYYFTLTDSLGQYDFTDIPPFEDWNIGVYFYSESVTGMDATPDGDEGEENGNTTIAISLEEGEHDDGNNFEIEYVSYESSLSGQVLIDLDNDQIADSHVEGVLVSLYRTDESGVIIENMGTTGQYTDNQGNYRFDYFKSGYYAIKIDYQNQYQVIATGDTTPNLDDPDQIDPTVISNYVGVAEKDENNDFLLKLHSSVISGHVIIDTDGDGDPDVPAFGENIELYQRDSNGDPTSQLVAETSTNAQGYYAFDGLNPSEYVIKYVGTGNYLCLLSGDISPEVGEPEGPGCLLIPVDILTEDSHDGDNVFVVE